MFFRRAMLASWAGPGNSDVRDELVHARNNDTIHIRNNLISTCTSEGHPLPQKKFYKSRLCICPRGPLLDGVVLIQQSRSNMNVFRVMRSFFVQYLLSGGLSLHYLKLCFLVLFNTINEIVLNRAWMFSRKRRKRFCHTLQKQYNLLFHTGG